MTSRNNPPDANSVSEKQKDFIVRFQKRQRIEHIVIIVLFTLLSFTGLIQLFYANSFSESLILGLGGIQTVRLIHRALGITFTGVMLYHAVFIIYSLVVKRRNPSIMPNIQDFRDVISELKTTLGFKAQKPQFGRYDYKQKFEYVGLIFGSIVLIATGLMLMFPEVVTIFIPGQFIAAAARIHGYEATLAVLTILIWHLYSVVLRPGIFPADTSIYTGKISRERMLEEHPLEYQKMLENGVIKE